VVPDKFRWAIIGCGVISTTHADAVAMSKYAKLVATCDIDVGKAQKLAADYGADVWYQDYNELLKRDDIDAVSICVPSGIHAEITIAAAKAGKHILCEKPLDISSQKMDEMIAVCHEEGVKLGCVFQMRTYANNQLVRKMLQEQRLGKVVIQDCYVKYNRSQEYYKSAGWRGTWEMDGGGCLMNQGVHGLDLLLWMGGDVESLVAQADHLVRDIEVEDTAVAILKFKSGAFGVIEGATSVTPGQKARFEFLGNDGSILMEDAKITKWAVPGVPEPETVEQGSGNLGHINPAAITASGHIYLVDDLVGAVREQRDPFVTGESARKAVDLILAIYESSRTGQRVTLA